jgi:hypothetical protein
MKSILPFLTVALIFYSAFAQEPLVPKPLFLDDPKGLKLPAAVPRMVDTNGNVVWIDEDYTTRQYQKAASRLVLQEANQVAKELRLREKLPITQTDLVETVVTPFGFNYRNQSVGSVTTKNYCYYVSQGNKFCYLEATQPTEVCKKYQDLYTWPANLMDTNRAYQLATQWLAAVSMDVKAMNRDCHIIINADNIYVHPPHGKFVPLYWIFWQRKGYEMSNDAASAIQRDVASVGVFTPTETLLQLRVEDPKYIMRKPLVFTNLDSLLPGVAPIIKLPPPQPGPVMPPG